MDGYYRAIYLTERTARNLGEKLSQKLGIDAEHTVRIIHIHHHGIKVVVEDDVVQTLPDGQDMVAQVSEIASSSDSIKDSNTGTQITLRF